MENSKERMKPNVIGLDYRRSVTKFFILLVVLSPAVTGLTLWHVVSTQAHIGVAILIARVICPCRGK